MRHIQGSMLPDQAMHGISEGQPFDCGSALIGTSTKLS